MEKLRLCTLNIFLSIVCVISILGCAAVKEPPRVLRPGEERIVRDNTELLALAREYEEKKQFKKALNTLKDLQSADPYNRDIRSRIKKLETGLNDAVQRHLAGGRSYFQSGDQAASRKEFLMVLFLDPENRDALDYLRRLSDTERPGGAEKPEEVMPEARAKDYKDFIEHTLQQGESLSILAQMYYGDKMKYDIIADFNGIKDINKVHVGQKIKVPVLEKMGPSYQPAKARPEPLEKPAKVIPQPVEKPAKVSPESVEKPAKEPAVVKEKEAVKEEPPQKAEKQKPAKPDMKNVEETFNKAEKFFQEEKYKEAIDNYQKVVRDYPEHPAAGKRLDASKKIISYLQNGNEFVFTRKYGNAYDEYNKALALNPRSAVAKRELDKLVPSMLAQASYLLHDEQSPCKAIEIIEKVLKKDPYNKEAQDLLDEATTLEEGLDLKCGRR